MIYIMSQECMVTLYNYLKVHSLKPVIQQYNSPQPLYSQENVEEVLNQQAEVLANGVKG